MPKNLRVEYQAKKRELEKARELAERLQREGEYYDMAARLTTAKKSLSVLETQWKRLQALKAKTPKTLRNQKKEKNLDLEILEVETQIGVLESRIDQITTILIHTQKPSE